MHYIVTYFDTTGQGKFLPLFRAWLRYAAAAGIQPSAISMLTDKATLELLNEQELPRIGRLAVDPCAFNDLLRPNNAFDYKSALICAALPIMPPSSVVMDCDAIIHRNPSDALKLYDGEPFAMVPDSGKRCIPWERGIPEHSSSVMFFGEPDSGIRGAIVDSYRSAWKWLSEHDDARGIINEIREQRAWSLLHFWADAVLMPPELNWSPYHWPKNEAAYIVHHHGAKKFSDIR